MGRTFPISLLVTQGISRTERVTPTVVVDLARLTRICPSCTRTTLRLVILVAVISTRLGTILVRTITICITLVTSLTIQTQEPRALIAGGNPRTFLNLLPFNRHWNRSIWRNRDSTIALLLGRTPPEGPSTVVILIVLTTLRIFLLDKKYTNSFILPRHDLGTTFGRTEFSGE